MIYTYCSRLHIGFGGTSRRGNNGSTTFLLGELGKSTRGAAIYDPFSGLIRLFFDTSFLFSFFFVGGRQ